MLELYFVILMSGELRLAGRTRSTTYTISGRLGIKINNTWGSLCSNGWDISDATVACKQLGYDYAVNTIMRASSKDRSGIIWFGNPVCNGTEKSLLHCSHSGFENHNCRPQEEAGLICGIGIVHFPCKYCQCIMCYLILNIIFYNIIYSYGIIICHRGSETGQSSTKL